MESAEAEVLDDQMRQRIERLEVENAVMKANRFDELAEKILRLAEDCHNALKELQAALKATD